MDLTENKKIVQTNIHRRIMFKDVFKYIRENNIEGYLVFVNIDIFFDESIGNLITSQLDEKKEMFALLRYEYNGNNIETSPIFGPRSDSQGYEQVVGHEQPTGRADRTKSASGFARGFVLPVWTGLFSLHLGINGTHHCNTSWTWD
jgi:hypothetical protein